MNMQTLYHFVIFAESPSMQEAATRLGITQPALTKQLQQLERSFPQPLFTLQGKRKVLTGFGEKLRQQLKMRLGDLPEMLEQMGRNENEPTAARVRLMARREILDRISRRTDWPGPLILQEGSNNEILRALEERKTDVGITHGVPTTSPLIAKPLFRESFQFAVAFSLLKRGKRTPQDSESDILKDLQRIPCVAYREYDEILKSACEERDLQFDKLTVHRVTANYQSLAQMIDQGLGWGVIPSHYPLNEARIWTAKIPFRSSGKNQARDFQLLYRRDMKDTRWLKEFLQTCLRSFTPKP